MASRMPASPKSGSTRGPRTGGATGLRISFAAGGIERAGAATTGRGGATCLVGSGSGSGAGRRRAAARDLTATLVARAGVVARARLTLLLAFLTDTVVGFLPAVSLEPEVLAECPRRATAAGAFRPFAPLWVARSLKAPPKKWRGGWPRGPSPGRSSGF